MGISDKSNDKKVRENLWYFSEEIDHSLSPKKEKVDFEKVDGYKKITKGKNENFTPKAADRTNFKKVDFFVVDWQLSDSL